MNKTRYKGDWDWKESGYEGVRYFETPIPDQKFSVTISWTTLEAGPRTTITVHHQQTFDKVPYGGDHYINADAFGNIHFGYIGRAVGYGYSTLRWISNRDAPGLSTYKWRLKEALDEGKVKWGYELEARWHIYEWNGNYFKRK